ncbi:MAG: MBL fold metallo-hydrolase, partial [Deltaproteobacteria bacterium]
PFSVSHDAADSVGFTVQDGSIKVGIATDLGTPTQLVCHHLKGCQLIVLEANHDLGMLEDGPYPWHVKQRIQSRLGHLSNEASRDLLWEVSHGGLGYVILAHISETNNHPERALSVVREAVSDSRTRLSIAWQHAAGEVIRL